MEKIDKIAPSAEDVLGGVGGITNYKDSKAYKFVHNQANFASLTEDKRNFLEKHRELKVIRYTCLETKVSRSQFKQWLDTDLNFELCMIEVEEDIADELEYALLVKSGVLQDEELYEKIKDKGTRELSLALEAHNSRYRRQYKSVATSNREKVKNGIRTISVNMSGTEGDISGTAETGDISR